MTLSFTAFCDALLDDLTTNVDGLRAVRVHRYATYDPEQFGADVGERHLGVWPSADLESAVPLVTGPGGDMILQAYQVAYWEHAGDESSRGVSDEGAAADLLGLLEATRTRLYAVANTFLGGAELVRYLGSAWSDRSGVVRWFQIGVSARTSAPVG